MQVINHKLYLYKPDGTTFLGELIVDSLKVDIKLQEISTITFRIPEVINGLVNSRIDEVLDSYIIELWYGKVDGVYANGDFDKLRFRIYSTPLEFAEYQYLHSYAGYSIESDLEFKQIVSWPGIKVKDFFRTITYNNSAGSPAFTETGFSYNLFTSTNTAGTKYITIGATDEPTALDIFVYEIRENSANNSESEVSLIELSSGGVNSNDFKAGYYYLNKTGNRVDSVSIALPENYTAFNGSATATLSYKFYDNPVARAFAVGIKTNTSEPLSNMYIDLAQDAALGDDTPEYGGYTFTSQSIYSKNGLKLEDILDGGDTAQDGILYNTGFTVGTISATIAAKYRSNIDFNNITVYQAIKDIAESFESIPVFDTINKTVSFYAENEYGSNNGLVVKYATYLKSINKEIDASKIITNARALGKDNIKISLVNPTGKEVWEDYSYFLDDYHISDTTGFTIVADGTTGLDITYPSTSGFQSRWMDVAEAIKVAKWQYTRDYFHYVLSNNNATTIDSSHNTYRGLYNKRSEQINLYVKYETQYEKKKADEYKYFYLLEYYRDLYENKGTNLTEYQYYQGKYNTAVAQTAAFKSTVLDATYDNLYDTTQVGSLAYKFAQIQSFLDKETWSINEDKLRTFQRETTHNDSKVDNETDLLEATKIYVDENKEPKVTFNISIIDVLEAYEAYQDWDKFSIGDKIYIYFPEFNIDLEAQIRELSIDFQGKSLSVVISTVRNYNKSFGSYLTKNIRRFHNANLNTVLYYKDGTDASIIQTENVRGTLTNGIDAGTTTINTGATDASTGESSTTTSGEGQQSRVVTAVDLYTETLTLGAFTTGVKINDGRILTFKPFDVDDVEWTQEVEVSAENGFVIRRVYGDNTIEKLAYIDADDGSAYFAGWKLNVGQFSSGSLSNFVGINSQEPTTGNSVYAFWAGSETASTAPFSVTKAGAIVAKSGSIAGLTMSETGGIVKLFAGTGTWNHNNTPFYLDSTGKFSLEDQISWDPATDTLNIAGGISAQYGEIGGWTVDAKRLYAGSTTTRVELNSDPVSDYAIFAGNETAASAPFSVTKDGDLLATSATITGTINATSGTFNNTITVGTHTDKISIVGASTAAGTKIYSGTGTYNNANTGFYLDAAGKFSLGDQLYWDGAGNLQILGNLVADTGTIGGFTITDDTIQQGNDTSKLALQSDGTNPFLTIGQATNGYNQTGIFLGLDSGVSKLSLKSGTNSLLFDGTNLSITGAITSSSGTIGGWTIGANSLTGGDATLNSSGNLTLGTSDDVVRLSANDATYRVWVGNATAASAPFSVDKDGNIKSTAGEIGGFKITSSTIQQGVDLTKLVIKADSSNPYISIGQATNGYDLAGVFLGLDNSLPKLSLKSATNNLLWDGSSLSIKGSLTGSTGTFGGTASSAYKVFLGDATTPLEVKNDTTTRMSVGSNGAITLGALTISSDGASEFTGSLKIGSGESVFKADSNGIYLGNETFASAEFSVTPAGILKATAGTIGGVSIDDDRLYTGDGEFEDAATPFYLDTTGQFSLGTKFVWDGTDLVIDGEVTASAGTIGGFKITSTTIQQGEDTTKLTLQANASNPYLSIGQDTNGYNQDGIFLGLDSTEPKISLVGSTSSLTFDGDALAIEGGALTVGTNNTGTGSVEIDGDGIYGFYNGDVNPTFKLSNSTGRLEAVDIFLESGNKTAEIGNLTSSIAGDFGFEITNNSGYYIGKTDLSFAGSTISSTSTDLSVYKKGNKILVSGSVSNNNGGEPYTVAQNGTSTSLVVVETLVNESAGATINLTRAQPYKVSMTDEGFFILTVDSATVADKAMSVEYDSNRIWAKRLLISDLEDEEIASVVIGTIAASTNFSTNATYGVITKSGVNTVYMTGEGFKIVQGEQETFKVQTNGTITAETLVIRGNSTLGGWTVSDSYFQSNNYSYTSGNFSTAGIKFNNNATIIGKEFAIDSDGNAYFKGDLTAASGTFGIVDTNKGNVLLGGSDPFIVRNNTTEIMKLTNAGVLTVAGFTVDSSTIKAGTTSGNYFGLSTGSGTNNDVSFWAGATSNTANNIDTAVFRVKTDGSLFASNATISGTVNASGGNFTSSVNVGSGSTSGTINVGTDTKKIVISGTDDDETTKIYSGAGTYNSSDTGFYLDATGRFSLGNQLYYNPTTNVLEILGNIAADTGSIGGWNVGTSTITSSNVSSVSVPEIQLQKAGKIVLAGDGFDGNGNMTNPKLTIDGTATGSNAMISSDNFKINYNGSATFGKLNVGTDGSIASTDNSFSISAAGAATFAGALSAATGSFGNTTINGSSTLTIGTYQASVSGDIKLSNASGIVARDSSNTTVFSVSTSGALVATNATITGTITATDGRIGSTTDGWDINANTLESKNDYIKLDAANNKILVGNIALQGDAAGNNSYIGLGKTSYALSGTAGIYAGLDNGVAKLSIGDTTNSLTWDGSALSVTGAINATSGNFTSTVNVGSGATSGTLSVGTDTNKIIITGTNDDDTTKIYTGTGTYNNANTPFYFDATGKFSLKDKLVWTGSALSITGAVTATSGSFAGSITADSGSIGGWYITADGIYTGTYDESGYTTSGITISNNGSIHSPNFYLDSTGITTKGGSIGGWILSASSLTGGDATLASSGNLTLGISNNVVRLSADDATYRIWAGNATAASAPFSVSKTGALVATNADITGEINATSGNFTSTVTVGSGATSGTINIGTDANNNKIVIVGTNDDDTTKIYSGVGTYNNANTPFYFDATGKFSLKDKLVWDGTNLNINGGGTFSGALSAATGSFAGSLSAATGTFAGSIQIGSGESVFKADSNGIYLGNETFANAEFSVTPAGALVATNATITGEINAGSGSIGSYDINENSIYKKLISKATFESTDADYNGWVLSGTFARSTTKSYSGSASVSRYMVNSTQSAITYTFSSAYASSVRLRFRYQFADYASTSFVVRKNGSTVYSVLGSSGLPSVWYTFEQTITGPISTIDIYTSGSTGPTPTLYIDEIELYEGTSIPTDFMNVSSAGLYLPNVSLDNYGIIANAGEIGPLLLNNINTTTNNNINFASNSFSGTVTSTSTVLVGSEITSSPSFTRSAVSTFTVTYSTTASGGPPASISINAKLYDGTTLVKEVRQSVTSNVTNATKTYNFEGAVGTTVRLVFTASFNSATSSVTGSVSTANVTLSTYNPIFSLQNTKIYDSDTITTKTGSLENVIVSNSIYSNNNEFNLGSFRLTTPKSANNLKIYREENSIPTWNHIYDIVPTKYEELSSTVSVSSTTYSSITALASILETGIYEFVWYGTYYCSATLIGLTLSLKESATSLVGGTTLAASVNFIPRAKYNNDTNDTTERVGYMNGALTTSYGSTPGTFQINTSVEATNTSYPFEIRGILDVTTSGQLDFGFVKSNANTGTVYIDSSSVLFRRLGNT